MYNCAGGGYFHVLAGICLGIITLVILLVGIYLITILIKIKRLIRELEETIRKAKTIPFRMIFGLMSSITKIRDFFTGKNGKNEKERREK